MISLYNVGYPDFCALSLCWDYPWEEKLGKNVSNSTLGSLKFRISLYHTRNEIGGRGSGFIIDVFSRFTKWQFIFFDKERSRTTRPSFQWGWSPLTQRRRCWRRWAHSRSGVNVINMLTRSFYERKFCFSASISPTIFCPNLLAHSTRS